MKTLMVGAAFALAASISSVAQAAQTVVNFDNLTGGGLVADGYGGILWNQNWSYYDSTQDPYNASSPSTRIYTNYAKYPAGAFNDVSFNFSTAQVFNGAFFAGGYNPGVTFKLFKAGNLVHTSATLAQTSTPTFLASGYGGAVDEVRVSGTNGYYVMDDVTYSTAVPEPATWAMMIMGFGAAGSMIRRRKALTA